MKTTSSPLIICFCCISSVGVSAVSAEALSSGTSPSTRSKLRHGSSSHHRQTKSSESADDVAAAPQESMPTVPSPADIGANGFPNLPAVSTMLSAASQKLESMSSQASMLQASIARARQESTARVAKQKAIYEKKLKSQESQNKLEIAMNSEIAKNISKLTEQNAGLKKDTKKIRDTNSVLKSQLQALKSRLANARSFVEESLASTDESKADKVAVNQLLDWNQDENANSGAASNGAANKRSSKDEDSNSDDDDADNDDSDDEDDDAPPAALLARNHYVHRTKDDSTSVGDVITDSSDDSAETPAAMSPKDLLAALQQGVVGLTADEKDIDQKMKEIFLRDYKVGARRHAALIAQQRKLNATQSSLLTFQSKLNIARKHLDDTSNNLRQRLHGIGTFMQRLSHFALAPSGEALRALDDLPTTATLPDVAPRAASSVA